MKLVVEKRDCGKKGNLKKLRREGKIPAVLYRWDDENITFSVNKAEFQAIMRKLQPGNLGTSIFEIKMGGESFSAVVKEVQYEPTSYELFHLDFQLLEDERVISVKVPINFVGVADCAGVKLGGFLRQVLRSLRVKCLPKQIPASFTLNVAGLNIGSKARLSDITIPEGVKPLAKMDQVVAVVAKRSGG